MILFCAYFCRILFFLNVHQTSAFCVFFHVKLPNLFLFSLVVFYVFLILKCSLVFFPIFALCKCIYVPFFLCPFVFSKFLRFLLIIILTIILIVKANFQLANITIRFTYINIFTSIPNIDITHRIVMFP